MKCVETMATGHHDVLVFQGDPRFDADPLFEVWLVCENSHPGERAGLCIGTGATRDAAVGDAVRALEAAEEWLQGPPATFTGGR